MVHEQLQTWMIARGLRPADLARLTRVSSATASRWLRNLRRPRPPKRVLIERITKGKIRADAWVTDEERKRTAFLKSVA